MSGGTRAALFALLCFIWGSTWLVIKIGLADLPPFLAAALRFAGAALILLALARVRRLPLPRSRGAHLALLAIGVASYGVGYGVVYWAEQFLPSGLTAVLFATHPLLVLVIAHALIPAERITLRKAAGVALGFAGVVLVFGSDLTVSHPRAGVAAAVLLLSPLTAASTNVAIKRWATHVHPYNLMILPMTYGTVILFAVSAATEDWNAARWTPAAIGSVLYLMVLGSVVAIVVYYTLLQQVAVSSLALLAYVFPIVAVLLGYLILDEVLEGRALAGAACILVGIAIATWRRRRVAPAVPEATGIDEARQPAADGGSR